MKMVMFSSSNFSWNLSCRYKFQLKLKDENITIFSNLFARCHKLIPGTDYLVGERYATTLIEFLLNMDQNKAVLQTQ